MRQGREISLRAAVDSSRPAASEAQASPIRAPRLDSRDMEKTRTYTAYSIGCFIVWAVIWAVVGTRADDKTRHQFLLSFLGWVMGWTSATIARAVYPPPRQRVIPETVKRGLAVLTIGNLVLGAVKLFHLLRHPATERVHGSTARPRTDP